MRAITAYAFRKKLGHALKRLRQNERFVILRHNRPVGIFRSIEDYVKEHPDQYDDMEDFLDTLLEEDEPEFQPRQAVGSGEVLLVCRCLSPRSLTAGSLQQMNHHPGSLLPSNGGDRPA